MQKSGIGVVIAIIGVLIFFAGILFFFAADAETEFESSPESALEGVALAALSYHEKHGTFPYKYEDLETYGWVKIPDVLYSSLLVSENGQRLEVSITHMGHTRSIRWDSSVHEIQSAIGRHSADGEAPLPAE